MKREVVTSSRPVIHRRNDRDGLIVRREVAQEEKQEQGGGRAGRSTGGEGV